MKRAKTIVAFILYGLFDRTAFNYILGKSKTHKWKARHCDRLSCAWYSLHYGFFCYKIEAALNGIFDMRRSSAGCSFIRRNDGCPDKMAGGRRVSVA